MIVRPSTKSAEQCSLYPNSNWYENEPDNLVVDETTEEGQILMAKILSTPFYDLVIDDDGKLVDITPTDPPDGYEIPETPEQKITKLETENADLKQQLSQFNNDFVAFVDFYFANNPDQA